MLLPLTSSGPLIKQVHGKTIRGTEAAPLTWKNEVKQVTEVNLKLTWNEKLERETVFACCQSSCKRGSFISLTIIERNANDFYRYSYIDSHQDVGECIYLDFVYLAVKIRCPREAPCLCRSPNFPEGRCFWNKQALLFKDSWAEMFLAADKTSDWNQSAGVRGSDKLLVVVPGKVGAFLSKVNQWLTSTGRTAVIDPRLSAFFNGSLCQDGAYRLKDKPSTFLFYIFLIGKTTNPVCPATSNLRHKSLETALT